MSVLYTMAPADGVMAFICTVFTRVMTNTLELLSSSSTELGSIFCGLSPILIWACTAIPNNRQKKKWIYFIFNFLVFSLCIFVQGSRFKVQGSRFKVQGSRFKVFRHKCMDAQQIPTLQQWGAHTFKIRAIKSKIIARHLPFFRVKYLTTR